MADKSEVIPVLLARHTERAANDPEFQQLAGVAAELQRLRSETSLSLNETERQRDNAALEKKLAGLSRGDDGLLEGERDLAADKSAEKAAAKEKDVRLLAAARIIADEAALARNKEAVAKAAAGTQAANLR